MRNLGKVPIRSEDPIIRFRQDLQLRGRHSGTLLTYTTQLNLFQAWYTKDLLQVGPEELKGYLASLRERELKTNSIVHAFTALGAFYDFLEMEGEIQRNPVPAFRKRYLQQYKAGADRDERRCISIEEAARLIITALDSRKQAIIILLAKTGMRVHELAALDVTDVDMIKREIRLKPTPKRSNRTLFFDEEAARPLDRWLSARAAQGYKDGALITGLKDGRLRSRGMEEIVQDCSRLAGVGDSALGKDYITPHYFRVFFTTQLLRAGMPRHHIQALRGDIGGDAIDIYTRIDREELRRSYLAHIPQLGI
jgi:integrase/recombinase XerD